METALLKEAAVTPTKRVLEKALGRTYPVYEQLLETITGKNYDLVPRWNYYNDGKMWLCKVQFKKKTVFWLSVWDKCFKMGFYFTQKNCQALFVMDIDENIKKEFKENKPIGKLLPLTLIISKKTQLKDALKIIEYKKSLK